MKYKKVTKRAKRHLQRWRERTHKKPPRFISLFGGIGGFDLALQKEGFKGVWYNDFDKYATQVYNKNFKTNHKPRDITRIKAGQIPKHDILCAGFPCQSFSIAGKRKGFEDTRGTMFFEICRIAKHHRTPILLLENVKGILSHDEGNTFRVILETLDELGYNAQWQVLNSKHYGVPQNRERVFIIANLRTRPTPQIFPFTEDAGKVQQVLGKEIVSPTITTENAHGYGNTVTCGQTEAIARSFEDVANCLDANMHKGIDPEGFFEKKKRNVVKAYKMHRVDEMREHDGSPTLTENMGTGGHNVPMVMDYRSDEGFRLRDGESPTLTSHGDSAGGIPVPMVCAVLTPSRENARQEGRRMKESEEPMFTLTGQDVHGVQYNQMLRRLTPVECERLQGFPDGWTEKGKDEKGRTVTISDTQRYKMCGNAVTVNVVRAIAKKLMRCME